MRSKDQKQTPETARAVDSPFDPRAVFADPVAYLSSLGIASELVAPRALAPAA